jgi:hypothetical protein
VASGTVECLDLDRPSRVSIQSRGLCLVYGRAVPAGTRHTMVCRCFCPLFEKEGSAEKPDKSANVILSIGIRLFPYMVTVGSLGVAFIISILFLAVQNFLLPRIIILGSFVMWVLSLTGMIETSLQLYGGQANINANCQNYVTNQEYSGNTVETLAWLTQNNICE